MANDSKNLRGKTISAYLRAKKYREARMTLRGYVKDGFLICIGIFSAAFGLKSFLCTCLFINYCTECAFYFDGL